MSPLTLAFLLLSASPPTARAEMTLIQRDPTLNATLNAALEAKGPSYAPRTHHLEGGAPTFTNRLILETSPYLLQHAHNPVDWWPWGEAAFAAAQALDRPILLSVGYSTCHWCHVMERESFEDLEIAAYINAHYIPIKVDREERPDVDHVYMEAVRLMTGGGGWPMTVVLTPTREPFFGGTYFPPRAGARGARAGFWEILHQLSALYQEDRDRVLGEAKRITKRIQADAAPQRPEAVPGPEALISAAHFYAQRFDKAEGGFDTRPKFPRPVTPSFLLGYAARTGDDVALEMTRRSLEGMARGGIYDQLGGGFHRYSVDARWRVPHFEKMLYDNAQLVSLYLAGWQATRAPLFKRVVEETLDYVLREMTAPGGGFYSATDADSVGPDGESEEGLFFTWTPAEIEGLVGEEARWLLPYFEVTARGDLDGRNVLRAPLDIGEAAAAAGVDPTQAAAAFSGLRQRLYDARALRQPPLRDDKILTAWNGMMLGAFARAGFVLNAPRYLDAARAAASTLLRGRHADGGLKRILKAVESPAFLSDYAFFIEGLLDLFEATGEPRWLDAAVELQALQDERYADPRGGYFSSAEGQGDLLTRAKPDYDGAEPAGASAAALNLLRLSELRQASDYRTRVEALFGASGAHLRRAGPAQPRMLEALSFYLDKPKQIVVVAGEGYEALLAPLRAAHLPNKVVILASGEGGVTSPLAQDKVALKGQATAYVCEAGRCERPTTDPAIFAAQLKGTTPLLPDRSPAPLPSL